ncbi:MAG: DUF2911 domain-containing protein [Flavitalea sp.]
MKRSLLLITLMLVSVSAMFCQSKLTIMDKSPMDVCYYPCNFPILKIQDKVTEPLAARIVYSRPQKNGRMVFGELVEYGEIWRLGANEATEIELFKDATVEGSKLKKGRYTMYAVPFEEKWTIIFNKETDIWGAFHYDQTKDVLRVEITPEKLEEPAEAFTMMFEKITGGANLVIAWDDVVANIVFNF